MLVRRFGTRQALADAFWILLLIITILLIRIGMPVTKIILLAGLSIFVLRFAPRIPGLRWFWVGLFGERTFWDWMTLLCAPILLSSIGVLISTSINNLQSDVSITKERLGLANDYYNEMSELILTPEFQNLVNKRKAAGSKQPPPTNDKEHCNPIPGNALSSIAYSRTAAALRTLKRLKTSEETYTPMQQSILQLLYYSDLIKRRGHVISLQQTQFSGASLRNIYLSKSCFDSVNFDGADLARAKLSDSNLRRSSLEGASLNAANFANVNLSLSSLRTASGIGTDFTGSDLRRAHFDNAVLQGAQFTNGDLRGANFVSADLRNAKFGGADLRNANFEGADLRGADLRLTRMNEMTTFNGARYNSIRLDNMASAKQKEAYLKLMQALKIDKAFDIRGLVVPSLKLEPLQHDATFSPKDKEMTLDHRI